MAHRSTWESPKNRSSDKPIFNQIDYILVDNKNKRNIVDSRSYAGFVTDSDHKVVICKIEIKQYYKDLSKKKQNRSKINIENFKNSELVENYKLNIERNIVEDEKEITWKDLSEKIKNAGASEIGINNSGKQNSKNGNDLIKSLSDKQKKLKLEIYSAKNKTKKRKLQKERNQIMKQIQKELKIMKEAKELNEIEELNKSKDDSTKMFKIMSKIYKGQPKEKIYLNDKEQKIIDENYVTNKITDHFKSLFNTGNSTDTDEIKPVEMVKPFTKEEVISAVNKLKINKSPGPDNITAEELKNCPDIVFQKIADIFNKVATEGDFVKEINEGLLIPLQKPGKPKGELDSLRPVILLNTLRKILCIIMFSRIFYRVDQEIPVSQAAYRPGRSTTENVCCLKFLIDKAITDKITEVEIMLLDMSKAFDNVDRYLLLEDLKSILEPDELHILKVLIYNVKLCVRNGDTVGEEFFTDIGVPQGDCLSPILFTLYLAKTLKSSNKQNNENKCCDHSYAKDSNEAKNAFAQEKESGITIDQQFADDVSWATTSGNKTKQIEIEAEEKLSKRNLKINKTKTENFKISGSKDDNNSWKKCKYLGTMLDTEEDIDNRKKLALFVFNKYKTKLTNKKLSLEVRLRLFNSYVKPIFLYNSELWTVTKNIEHEIDVFHRKLLRYVLKIYYPYTISNNELYTRTKEIEWSILIKQKRFKWTGHMLRLPETTPVRLALTESLKISKKKAGQGNRLTLVKLYNKDLAEVDSKLSLACDLTHNLAEDRDWWRQKAKGLAVVSKKDG